ncbi:MAG: FTR1 family protein [Chloroflexia bacterium]|nr:FTR1 family protein [Chloroflexia bacterium]
MRLRLHPLLLLAVVCLVVAPVLRVIPATAAATGDFAPGLAAQAMRSQLFDAQAALLAGDDAAAREAIAAASAAAAPFVQVFATDPAIVSSLETGLGTAGDAVAKGDAPALALAHGQIWSTLARGAYARTLSAAAAGDAETAAAWLLREFRVTTRYDRPHADATLAIQGLREGGIAPNAAETAIRADLLDTYQARLEAALNTIAAGTPGARSSSAAEAVGLATGFWPLLAPALEDQMGITIREDADTTFTTLLTAAVNQDARAFDTARANATEIVQSFRAAPLSEEDQARRAGQLLRYLSLVPLEYGRGVTDGQVLLAIEIQEAQAFLDGAEAAFADLRLPLRTLDTEETAAIAAALASLDTALASTSSRVVVADPADIEAIAADASRRLTELVPPFWLEASGDSDFDIVASMLDQMVAAVAAGQYHQAESSRIEAYAIFETGPEKRLLAFTPSEAQRVERLFWEGDGQTPGLRQLLSSGASENEIRASRGVLDTALRNAQAALNAGTAPAAVVFNAATIVFREGLEAILILASLLASMIGLNRQYKRPLAIGALTALGATAVLFVLARTALLSFGRYSEQIEAIVSIVAIGVLLLVMNWFFHKVYWTRWIAKHHEQRRRLLIGGTIGPALGFVLLGFTSVFREGAETVLFLQALVLDAGTLVVIQGTLLGLVAVAIVGALTLVLQTKLPHKKMLVVTGVMIAVVLVTMVGSTVHTLQLVGWAPISPIPGTEGIPYFLGVWFGIHGTWQGIAAQIAAFAFVIGSYVIAERLHKRSRRTVGTRAVPAAARRGEIAAAQ